MSAGSPEILESIFDIMEKGAMTSVDLSQLLLANSRHFDEIENGKCDNREILVTQINKLGNYSDKTAGDLSQFLLSAGLRKIFMNYQLQICPILPPGNQSARRDNYLLLYAETITDNYRLVYVRWTSQEIMMLQCSQEMDFYTFFVGRIHFFSLVNVMSCQEPKDPLYLSKPVNDGAIIFEAETQLQYIQKAFSMDFIQIDPLYLYYPGIVLFYEDFEDQTNRQCVQLTFSTTFIPINPCYIFNPVSFVMSNRDLEDFGKIQNLKHCKEECNKELKKLQDVGKVYMCNSLSHLCICDAERLKKFIIDQIANGGRILLEENEAFRQQLLEKDELINKKTREIEMLKNTTLSLERKCQLLEEKLSKLEEKHGKMEKDYEELFVEHGRLLVENDSKVVQLKETEQFQKIFLQKSSISSIANIEGNTSCDSGAIQNGACSSSYPLGEQSVPSQRDSQIKREENGRALNTENESNVSTEQVRFSVEVVERDSAVSSSVPADVYNAYRILLLTISDRLLYDDIIRLQEWANEKFSIQTNLSANEVFIELDKKGAISALDLNQLCAFFESIVRHDLLHLIDEFKNGDYDKLRKLVYQNKLRKRMVSNSNQVLPSRARLPISNTPGASRRPISNAQVNVSNVRVLNRSSATEDNNSTSVGRNQQGTARFGSSFPSTSSPPTQDGSSTRGDSENLVGVSAVTNTRGNPGNERRINANDTPVTTAQVRTKQTLQSRQPPSQCNNTHHPAGRCNGAHSHTDTHLHGTSNGNNQDNWLCDHYKRRCLVKFECCDKYWACHRCHNNDSTCGNRKLKSRDTTMIKCVECGKEQEFGQFCVECNTQFADFFCGICKHLTGTDDHPYHCDKCGICRIHGDRSFHCDVCGICLDVQLRGNHKCRADSAHDECCICLEDAFTGCQILPCSHKVHKECATQMIRMGITRCPICRESFAHKLERRPVKRKTIRTR